MTSSCAVKQYRIRVNMRIITSWGSATCQLDWSRQTATFSKSAQAPVPLSIFRSNSMKIQNALVSNIFDRSQRYCAHVTTVTLSWRVQNIVVIDRVCFTLECFEVWSNFEFDRNMLSGTGARRQENKPIWYGNCLPKVDVQWLGYHHQGWF